MKRSLQEIIELIVFGLIALLVGTAVLWLLGWLFGIVGIVFKFIAGLIWTLLRFIIPIAIVAAVVYFVIRMVTKPKQSAPVVVGSSPQMASSSAQTITVEASTDMHVDPVTEPTTVTVTAESPGKTAAPEETISATSADISNDIPTAATDEVTDSEAANSTEAETVDGETDDKKDS